jgi:hypothetical protein
MLKCMEYDHVNRIKIKPANIKIIAENDYIAEQLKSPNMSRSAFSSHMISPKNTSPKSGLRVPLFKPVKGLIKLAQ